MNTIEPQNAKFASPKSETFENCVLIGKRISILERTTTGQNFSSLCRRRLRRNTIAATRLVWKVFGLTSDDFTGDWPKDNSQKQIGYLLLHAFNSNRFFALCERAFFSTTVLFRRVNLRNNALRMNARSNDRKS